MISTRKTLACVLALTLLALPASAASRADVADSLEDLRRYFIDFQQAPDRAVPAELLAECHGVIIMRQYKGGFIFGAKIGQGVILMHDRRTNQWSAPAFVRAAEGSVGFQIGGQAIDAIILIMNQAGIDMLLKTRFTVGIDASAAAGPIGRDLSADVGPGTALLTYSRAKGLFAGASFEGGGLMNNNEYNHVFYGQPVGLRDILLDRAVPPPAEAGPIIATLTEYSRLGQPAPGYAAPYAPAPYDYSAPPAPIGSIRRQSPGYYQADPYAPPYAGDPYAAPQQQYAPAPFIADPYAAAQQQYPPAPAAVAIDPYAPAPAVADPYAAPQQQYPPAYAPEGYVGDEGLPETIGY